MRYSRWICAMALATPMLAAEQMTVSVCTRGRVYEKAILRAEAVAASLFRPLDIGIVWAPCEVGLEGDAATGQHWFTVRFRDGQPFFTPEAAPADALGQAYLGLDGTGYIADVYYGEVYSLAEAKHFDLTGLLGYVMAHELGHLLLGQAHAAQGVMRAGWDRHDLLAIGQHYLRFSPEEGQRMRQVLHGG